MSDPNGVRGRVKREMNAVALTTLYFAVCFGLLMLLKVLILAEYRIKFHHFSMALVGALILAKVVLVLEHVPMGTWLHHRPALVDVLARSILYGIGVLIVLLLEKAFEARHENGGFVGALSKIFQHPDMPHIWANAVCIFAALIGFNVLSVFRSHLGERGLTRLFLSPPARGSTRASSGA